MRDAAEWIIKQSINNPRVGSLEHKIMCDAIRDIQRDALLEAAEIASKHIVNPAHPHHHFAVEIHDAILARVKLLEEG